MEQNLSDIMLDGFELSIKFSKGSWYAYLDGKEMRNLARIKLDLADNCIKDLNDVQLIFNFGSLIGPNPEKVI